MVLTTARLTRLTLVYLYLPKRVVDGNDSTLRVSRSSPVHLALVSIDFGGEDLVFTLGLPFGVRGLSVTAGVCESHCVWFFYAFGRFLEREG